MNRLMVSVIVMAAMVAGCKGREAAKPAGPLESQPTSQLASRLASQPVAAPATQSATSAAVRLSVVAVDTDALDVQRAATAQKLINGGVAFLLAQQQGDGSWSINGANRPAITGLALKVLLGHRDFGPDHPAVRRGLDVLMSYRQKDGGIYDPREGVANYTTAIAMMALTAAGRGGDDLIVAGAVRYMRGRQIVPGSESPDGKAIEEGDARIGGVNYGKTGEADMVNHEYWLEALKSAGVSGQDEAIQRSVQFVSNLQNLDETSKFAVGGTDDGGFRTNDGGFCYNPAESKAGGMRSYGTVTYAGFKSLLYAGVSRNDPRVVGAFDWIRTYWRLDSNPNMPEAQSRQGLYYYYQVFAKALRAWGEASITDMQGNAHNWRAELVDALAGRVSPDGSWTNDADRWFEGNPVLATCYSLMALQEALKK